MEMKGFGETSGTSKMKEEEEEEEEDTLKLNAQGMREKDLVGTLEEIEKLDAVLKIKLTEEKKAKLSRIQTEEESREVLNNMPRSKMSDRVKGNVEQFMKLLDEVVEKEAESSACFNLNDLEAVEGKEPDKKEGKKGKSSFQRTSSLTFVERNIRLAKCGRGTLSLTDEEKSRIEKLLEAERAEATEDVPDNEEDLYAIDRDAKAVLGEIDRRLEALKKLNTCKRHEKRAVPFEKSGVEKIGLNGKGKEDCKRGSEPEKKKGSRLEEINKLLNSMNSASDEEVIPLPEEELESLIELSKESLSAGKGSDSEDGGEQPNPKLPQQVIADLICGAKFLMPKFKYRFDES